ncbi:MAG: sodium-dependent bicarbonate transport family permease [Pseudomonadota bacterium]
MDMVASFAGTVLDQFQKPTLAFLIGGMLLAALGSKLTVPDQVYKFIVLVLLLKVGMGAGISVRNAEVVDLLLPALAAAQIGIAIVVLGSWSLARMKGVSKVDAYATAGLFGAVSASTLAAGMAILEDENIAYEGFIGALYPFMDIAALVTAITLAKLSMARQNAKFAQPDGTMTLGGDKGRPTIDDGLLRGILTDTFQSSAISALLLGLCLGAFAEPDTVYESFYEPLFRGLLSLLMLVMGVEAWARLSEMKKVAHAYILYGILGPLTHGLLGFGIGLGIHAVTGFSAGGVVLLAALASSSSDISGPPTMRGALPEANPSAYVGTSTGIGTPVAILSIPLWIALADFSIGV